MQERIAEYVATLKVKSIPDYETPARECSAYFDGRGIDMPNANDWEAFKEYYREKYRREKGKDISPLTLQQNYVARGKAFYKWCASQDGSEQTASLFEEGKTEAIKPPVPDEEAVNIPDRKEAEPKETDKPAENVRVNFLLSKDNHEALLSLVYLKGQTLTAILTEAIEAYIQGYSEEIATLEETRRKFRSK